MPGSPEKGPSEDDFQNEFDPENGAGTAIMEKPEMEDAPSNETDEEELDRLLGIEEHGESGADDSDLLEGSPSEDSRVQRINELRDALYDEPMGVGEESEQGASDVVEERGQDSVYIDMSPVESLWSGEAAAGDVQSKEADEKSADTKSVGERIGRRMRHSKQVEAEIEAYKKLSESQRQAESERMSQAAAEVFEFPDEMSEQLSPRWTVKRPLSKQGGMDAVYEVFDGTLLQDGILKMSERAGTRFESEAKTLARLESDFMPRVYDAGWSKEGFWYAMEKVKGKDLMQELQEQKVLFPEEVVKVAKDVAQGLWTMHEHNIVHRDIKPANIIHHREKNEAGEMIKDNYMIVDFGLIKHTLSKRDEKTEREVKRVADASDATEESGESHQGSDPEKTQIMENPPKETWQKDKTEFGSIIGTPYYMSPEQATGGEITKKTDIWSLGVLIYEMTTGEKPFTGDKAEQVLTSIIQQKEPVPRLDEKRDDIPKELADLVERMFSRDEGQRPSAQEVVKELLQISKSLREKPKRSAEVSPREGNVDLEADTVRLEPSEAAVDESPNEQRKKGWLQRIFGG